MPSSRPPPPQATPTIQSHNAAFKVLGSTADVDARDNTTTTYTADDKGVAVYWLNGVKVADDYEDFYDGSWSNADGGQGRGRGRPHEPTGRNSSGYLHGQHDRRKGGYHPGHLARPGNVQCKSRQAARQ